MFDIENLRIRELIEERIEYENDFIYIPDIIKSEELDYYTGPIYARYYEGDHEIDECGDISMNDIDLDFDFDDYLDRLRDEQMIEIHEAEIAADYLDIDDYYAEYDPLDAQIDSLNDHSPYKDYLDFMAYEDYISECDLANNYYCFDSPFDDCYVEEVNMEGAYCGDRLFGYVVVDDEFDSLGECDYPEGPSENLEGFRYPETEYFDGSFMDFECQMDAFDEMQSILEIQESYGEYLVECHESHMQKIIEEHIREENEFLQFVKENEIPDEYYMPAGAEDIIFT